MPLSCPWHAPKLCRCEGRAPGCIRCSFQSGPGIHCCLSGVFACLASCCACTCALAGLNPASHASPPVPPTPKPNRPVLTQTHPPCRLPERGADAERPAGRCAGHLLPLRLRLLLQLPGGGAPPRGLRHCAQVDGGSARGSLIQSVCLLRSSGRGGGRGCFLLVHLGAPHWLAAECWPCSPAWNRHVHSRWVQALCPPAVLLITFPSPPIHLQIKNSAESENLNWILANTKPCPKCT